MVELILENLHIMYDDFHAVKGVDLKIKGSEIVTLLGPSGCGKTSILRAIAGFTTPSQGRILLDDVDITSFPPQKRNMGMIFQNYALWPHMSVEANIGYGLKIRKTPREERKKTIMEMVKQVQLEGHDQKYPTQLSGGQQQRVALARALAISPKVLLCDEPLSNLDFKLRVELRTEIRDISKDMGVTVVYVTHDQTEALAISDRIAVIDEGVIIQDSSPLSVFNDPDTQFVASFVGENNTVGGIVKSLTDGQVLIELANGDNLHVTIQNNTLEVGSQVQVVSRFDDLIFNPNSEEQNVVRGTLKRLTYMGAFLQIEVVLADATQFFVNIVEDIPNIAKLPVGSDISVGLPQKSLYLFQNGKRIR